RGVAAARGGGARRLRVSPLFERRCFVVRTGDSLGMLLAGAVPTLRAGTSAGAAGASGAALERPTLVLAQSAPDSCILTGFQGPLQAGLGYFTAATYGLRFLNLKQGGSGVADREEELRILIEACCTVSPIHGDLSTNSVNAVDRARIPGAQLLQTRFTQRHWAHKGPAV